MPLDEIDFATDEELVRYESEIVVKATDVGLSLDAKRALALQTITLEAVRAGIDRTKILDDGSDRSLAMRDWATRLVIFEFWRDLSSGRDSAVMTAKARLAKEDADEARELFFAIGWPLDTNANDTVDAGENQPAPRRSAIALGTSVKREVFIP